MALWQSAPKDPQAALQVMVVSPAARIKDLILAFMMILSTIS